MDAVADLVGGAPYVVTKVPLVQATGSLPAGYLLSYLWGWTNSLPPEREGWFYKTMVEMYAETGMSRSEQETGRKRLRELGLLEEEKRGIPMKIWYRLDKDALAELLRAFLATNLAGIPQDGVSQPGRLNRRDPARRAAASRQAKTDTSADTSIYTATPPPAPERGKDILREKMEELKRGHAH